MVKIDNNSGKNGPDGAGGWWQPAVEIFTEVSGWIAGPIILALILGKYLDGRLGTKPWIFIGLTITAFLISSFGIVRVVGRYMKNMEEESKSEKDLEQK
ncbi:MAG: AtpZ/AtpI family protein [Candidatus Paceibacterota bacterium]